MLFPRREKTRTLEHRGRRDCLLHLLYELGVWFKGIDGALECCGGILLLFTSTLALKRFVVYVTQHEIAEDPTDWIALHLRRATAHLQAPVKLFASGYLLGHGAIKVFLVWGGLLRRKLWSFPTAIIFLGAFLAYQSYRLVLRFSILLMALTIIDLVVLLLIWREYTLIKKGAS